LSVSDPRGGQKVVRGKRYRMSFGEKKEKTELMTNSNKSDGIGEKAEKKLAGSLNTLTVKT